MFGYQSIVLLLLSTERGFQTGIDVLLKKNYEMYCRSFLQCELGQDYFKRSLREIVKS